MIAGLGNPGTEYRNTRHNIGFQVIIRLSHELGVRLNGRRFQSRNTRAKLQAKEIMLLRPSTFMNLSGKSIKACADFYNIKGEDILIIHDDLDLPEGKIKIVQCGGSGGHRGIQSIIDHFDSTFFPRVKIGIGRPKDGEAIEDYVLTPFYDEQKEVMEKAIQTAAQACRLFILYGIESAMNQIN